MLYESLSHDIRVKGSAKSLFEPTKTIRIISTIPLENIHASTLFIFLIFMGFCAFLYTILLKHFIYSSIITVRVYDFEADVYIKKRFPNPAFREGYKRFLQ